MLKNISRLECKVNEKDYQLFCDNDSPIEHVKEALFQFLKYIGQLEDQNKVMQEELKKKSEEEQKVEEPKVEVINVD